MRLAASNIRLNVHFCCRIIMQSDTAFLLAGFCGTPALIQKTALYFNSCQRTVHNRPHSPTQNVRLSLKHRVRGTNRLVNKMFQWIKVPYCSLQYLSTWPPVSKCPGKSKVNVQELAIKLYTCYIIQCYMIRNIPPKQESTQLFIVDEL